MDNKRLSPEKRSPSKRGSSRRKISSNMALDSTASSAYEEKLKELGLKKIWLNVMRDYDLVQQLGQGSFGLVYEGKCRVTGRTVALKLIHNFSQYEYDCVKVIREIQIMRGLHQTSKSGVCCFIPELLDLIIPDDEDETNLKNIFLVMEYEQSDLRQLLKLGLSSKLTEEHVKLILYNLLCAFKYLHSANVIHRDIKPSNILINKDCQIKICDFGLSRTLPESCIGSGSGNSRRIRESISKNKLHKNFTSEEIRQVISMKLEDRKKDMNQKKRSLSSHVGSRWYRPPEISLIMKQYDSASDLWSLGCCLFELMRITGDHGEQPSTLSPSQKKLSQIMFPGECCYPLSPKVNKKDGKQDDQILQDKDQMRITIDRLSKMDESDLAFITHDEAKNYVEVLQEKSVQSGKRKHFLEDVPGSNKQLKDILENLVQINPYFRWTPSELIKLSYFDDLRIHDLEKSAPQKIKLEVDSDAAFDYEGGVSKTFTKKDYIAIIVKEANFVHKARQQYLKKMQDEGKA